MRRSSPGYYRTPKRNHRTTILAIRCVCGRTFGSSRELREHETRCQQIRAQRDIDALEGRAG